MYLPALEGYVPVDMLRAFRAFLEFCYIVRHEVITEGTLQSLREALERYHHYRKIFVETGCTTSGFALPRQHSMVHYFDLIRLFGAPNGLCSSITESKHSKAVKGPWRRSNRYNPLGQVLYINQRLDKLAAMRVDFTERGMIEATGLRATLDLIGRFLIIQLWQTMNKLVIQKVFEMKKIYQFMHLSTKKMVQQLRIRQFRPKLSWQSASVSCFFVSV